MRDKVDITQILGYYFNVTFKDMNFLFSAYVIEGQGIETITRKLGYHFNVTFKDMNFLFRAR